MCSLSARSRLSLSCAVSGWQRATHRRKEKRTLSGTSNLKAWAAVVVAAAVAACLLALLVTTKPAEAAGRYRTVTKTLSNASAITINASSGEVSPYPSQVAAAGFKKGKIKDVNVTLKGYSHTYPDDMDVLLLGPGGQNAIIMSDTGSMHDLSNITLTLDDEAANFLYDGGPHVSGTFKPNNVTVDGPGGPDTFPFTPSGAVELSTFDGTNPNGTWSLYVDDDFPTEDGGELASGWSLQIKARVRR
jgi:subtilisin-like proprotein convertase family protein